MKTLQVSMQEDKKDRWEAAIAKAMGKLDDNATKGDAMDLVLPAVELYVAEAISPSTASYVSTIDTYLSGIASQVSALADLYASREKTYDEDKARELKAINDELTAKAQELAEAAAKLDEAERERDEALAALEDSRKETAEQEQRALTAEAQCELLEDANRDLQQSLVALAAALDREDDEGGEKVAE